MKEQSHPTTTPRQRCDVCGGIQKSRSDLIAVGDSLVCSIECSDELVYRLVEEAGDEAVTEIISELVGGYKDPHDYSGIVERLERM